MKILFILNSNHKYISGGAEIQTKYISEYFQRKGFDINFIFIHETDDVFLNEKNMSYYGIKRKKKFENIFGKICYYNQVYSIIKEIKPNVIYHRNLSNLALSVIKYCKVNNCLSLLHLAHKKDVQKETIIKLNFIKHLFNYFGKQQILKHFKEIIAQANYQDKLLMKNFNRSSSLVIKNVHPVPDFNENKNRKVKIVWVANFKSWKQPDLFVKLAYHCINLDAEFIMVGRDSNNYINNMVNDIQFQPANLSFIGELSQDDVNNLLNDAFLFVNTSKYEGFPNTFIQSWLRGVPVISLNVNPDDIITKYDLGLHSITFDKLIFDVKYLVNNKDKRNAMSLKARKYALENHSFKNLDQLINLINKRVT